MHLTTLFRTVRELPRTVKVLAFVSLLNDASSEMLYPLLPLFLRHELRASLVFIGLLEGVAETTASLLKLISGWLADIIRQHKLMTFIGYALAGATRPVMAFVSAAWQVLLLRFIDRIGKGIRTSPRDALIANVCHEGIRGTAFGFHRSLDHFGALIGPLLASALLAVAPGRYRLVFLCASIPALLSLIALWFGVNDSKWETKTQPSAISQRPFGFNLAQFEARFRWLLLSVFAFTLSNSSDAFLLLRASQCHVPEYAIPALWTWLHIIKSALGIYGGALSDRIGRVNAIVFGWFVYALVYAGFGFASSPAQIWLLFTAYGFYFAMTEGAERALVADLVPEHIRGSGYGAFHFVVGMGMLPASLLFGALWEAFGAKVAFMICAALSMLAAFILLTKVKWAR
ncbi:MAG: MFS transporter [Armatimonadota bacterium]|nr:MFS transporter [Armatimonadota bacterium]MCX7778249.1 MFS transporter [Armatimonadota bacterium]MDW8025487.1 MFS transporter [Armatimonadota bacterium]